MLTLMIPYLLIAVVFLRITTSHLAWLFVEQHNAKSRTLKMRSPDGFQWLVGFVGGVVTALVWPLALFWMIPMPAVGAAARAKQAAVLKDAEAKRATAERRTAQLERELRLGA
jgi:uncharacterized membrane protein YfcA